MGWIFQGNPKHYDIDEYLSQSPEFVYWRTPISKEKIKIGHTTFLWRAGKKCPGVIAVGVVAEEPVPRSQVKFPALLAEGLWKKDSLANDNEHRTGMRLMRVASDGADVLLSRDQVKSDELLKSMTIITVNGRGTVFQVSDSQQSKLESLLGIASLDSLPELQGETEGYRRLRSHFVRERSPLLRDRKLHAFRNNFGLLKCEICSFLAHSEYPKEYVERIYEVHHRKPLSELEAPGVTQLEDLAVLCANCHRAVHATREVEANFQRLELHYQETFSVGHPDAS